MNTMTLAIWCACLCGADAAPDTHHAIRVIDKETKRGVPLVQLRTVNDVTYYTDSRGTVAFFEPGLMDTNVFFTVTSHGYEFPKDGFGFHGRQIRTVSGGETLLEIKRLNIAERLYRVTGQGIYADSRRLGETVPLDEPLLNGRVTGSDSVQCELFGGKLHWFWGDTNRPDYPLGNFHVPGATSELPMDGGLDPSLGVNLQYFVDADGFAKATCQMPGEGPTWIDGLVTIKDDQGQERLFAHYLKVKPPLTIYQHGMAEFNAERNVFERRAVFPEGAPFYPGGHPFLHEVDGTRYIYFARPFPLIRVRATADALLHLSRYEAFSCFARGSSKDDVRLARDPDGKIQYGWRPDCLPLTQALHDELLKNQQLKPAESIWNIRDADTNKKVEIHHGSISWNDFRNCWIMIASELNGSSHLGEVWYAEAQQPEGPWGPARKIMTHERQSFYNPKQHPHFAADGGRIVYFEGTYTNSFSGNQEATPRYNYNQVMYRLDLSDPRLRIRD